MKLEKQKLFWSKTRPRRNGCVEWLAGKTQSGYGRFKFGGKTCRAHRISWILTNGEIPDGLHVLHKCDNPSCVNPDHLFLGTHQDNMDDMISKGRQISGTLGKHHSEETRRKISEKAKGNKRNLGYKHTKEAKIKIGLATKNRNSHRRNESKICK